MGWLIRWWKEIEDAVDGLDQAPDEPDCFRIHAGVTANAIQVRDSVSDFVQTNQGR
jgi:hypothetical protein